MAAEFKRDREDQKRGYISKATNKFAKRITDSVQYLVTIERKSNIKPWNFK